MAFLKKIHYVNQLESQEFPGIQGKDCLWYEGCKVKGEIVNESWLHSAKITLIFTPGVCLRVIMTVDITGTLEKNELGETWAFSERDFSVFEKSYHNYNQEINGENQVRILALVDEQAIGSLSERMARSVFIDLCILRDNWVKEYAPKYYEFLVEDLKISGQWDK